MTIKNIYPVSFDKDQELDFDLLVKQAKVLYPEVEEWVLKIAVEAYIRQGENDRPDVSSEAIEEIRNKYDRTTLLYETPVEE